MTLRSSITRRIKLALAALIASAILAVLNPSPAAACLLAGCNGCGARHANTTMGQVSAEHGQTRDHFGTHSPLTAGTGELGEHQRFLINYLFLGKDNIGGVLPAMMLMTQQMSAVAMQQMLIVGTFFDAKHQLESQNIIREMAARAHKHYRPSTGMCTIGTNVRSLANAESRALLTAHTVARHALQRQLGNADVAAADGPLSDMASRLDQFKEYYCDRYENNAVPGKNDTGLGLICNKAPGKFVHNDLNYTRMIDLQRTLQVEFGDITDGTDKEATQHERDLFALSTNLFANQVFRRLSQNEVMLLDNHEHMLALRALVAKRSVAVNSFAIIAGMKTQGSRNSGAGAGAATGSAEDTAKYMRHLLTELGMTHERDIPNLLGAQGVEDEDAPIAPSYLSQMEILSKRLYQSPHFFTELYDSPANVRRKMAAMQGIHSMLQRDLHNSYQRNEMLMSVLLELRLQNEQGKVNNDLRLMNAQMEQAP